MRNMRIGSGHAAKQRKNNKDVTEHAEHADDQRQAKKQEERENWEERLCQGWLWVTWKSGLRIEVVRGLFPGGGGVARPHTRRLASTNTDLGTSGQL